MKEIYLWAIGVWFLFVILAIANAALRERILKIKFGDLISHQLSTIIFVVLILIVMYLFFNFTNLTYSTKDLWIIGVGWLILTIIFEFIFGHYIIGNSWERLFNDYNILKGRVWVLVLLVTLIGPYLLGKK